MRRPKKSNPPRARKPLHLTSARHRRRIRRILLLNRNINIIQRSLETELPAGNNLLEYPECSEIPQPSRSGASFQSFDESTIDDNAIDNNTELHNREISDSSANFCTDNVEFHTAPVHCRTRADFDLQLASAFLQGCMTHRQGNIILQTLRAHTCLQYLPKDMRTFLKTPHVCPDVISEVAPGEYLHLGFEKAVLKILRRTPVGLIPHILEIDWSTDGARLNSKYQIWPIQIRVANIPDCKPEVVGIYGGRKKPANPDEFLNSFITEVNDNISRGGIIFDGRQLRIELRAVIADTVARSFLLCHKGHNSANPCPKCKVNGYRYNKTMIFLGVDHQLRTNEEYRRAVDEDHHVRISPLSLLPMDMVIQVPIDGMHLLMGISDKFLTSWIKGWYGKKVKLPGRKIDAASRRMEIIAQYCPDEFARKPEPLNVYRQYKATQHRQFILYCGMVAMHGILNEEAYLHFLLLSTAMRCLACRLPSASKLLFARLALKKFITRCESIYDLNFMSYNIHALQHLVDDVEKFGPLDSFSAFPYENNMTFFRNYYRKPGMPLQQISYRLKERERVEMNDVPATREDSVKLFPRKDKGPMPPNMTDEVSLTFRTFRKLEMAQMILATNLGNNCCILKDSSICIVHNILQEVDDSIQLLVQKFTIVEDFFNVGIPSSSVEVFKCSTLSDFILISLNDVEAKCFRMPYWKSDSTENSDDEEDNNDAVCEEFIVCVLI